MAKQTGLGRGLETLLGGKATADSDAMVELDIKLIDPNPNQPRKTFDDEKLEELAASIRDVGVISPIIVARNGERYTIIAGERRFRAARKAKLSQVPAIIREYDAIKQMKVALIENLQRDDLNPIEVAQGIDALIKECALTQEQVAENIGKSRSAVTNLLRLLKLDEVTTAFVAGGKLSEGHARALLGVDDDAARAELARLIVQKELSVRQAEEFVRSYKNNIAKPPAKKPRSSELEQMESSFKRALGSTVKVTGTPDSGKISIQYKSFDEFERIYNIINQMES